MEEPKLQQKLFTYRGPSRKSHIRNLVFVLTVLMAGGIINLSYSLATGGTLNSPENLLRPSFIATQGSFILLYLLLILTRRIRAELEVDGEGIHYHSPISRIFDWHIAFLDIEKIYADIDDDSALLYIHHASVLSRQIRVEEWTSENADNQGFSAHSHPLLLFLRDVTEMNVIDNTSQ